MRQLTPPAPGQETASLAQRLSRQCAGSATRFKCVNYFSKRGNAKPSKAGGSGAVGPLGPFRVKSILVPIDFSAPSRKALGYAVSIARQFKAKLTLLHVVEPVATPDFAAAFPLALQDNSLSATAKQELEGLVRASRMPHGMVEKILVRFGRSFHEIASAARARKVNLIIISTHGYTGLKHALLGSTTERVVRHAPCPVLVVRQR